jgi:hypothetical protein
MEKIIFALGLLGGVIFLSSIEVKADNCPSGHYYRMSGRCADAPAGLCAACQKYGSLCCALQASVADCVTCSSQYGFTGDAVTSWCRKNQPQCARKTH